MNYSLCVLGLFAIVQGAIVSACPTKCKDSYKSCGKYCQDDFDYSDCSGRRNRPCGGYYDNDFDIDGRKCFETFVVGKEVPCGDLYGRGKFSNSDNFYSGGNFNPFGQCGSPKPCNNIGRSDFELVDYGRNPCVDKIYRGDKCGQLDRFNYDSCKPNNCRPNSCKPNCNPSKTVTVVINDENSCDNASPYAKPCSVKTRPTCLPVVENDCCNPNPKPCYPNYYPTYTNTYASNYKYPSYSGNPCDTYC